MSFPKPAVFVAVTIVAVLGTIGVGRLDADRDFRLILATGEQALANDAPHQAIAAFSEAISRRPSSMVGWYRRGEAYAVVGRFEDAERDLAEARRLAPTSDKPLEGLGRLYDRRGNPAAAARWYAEAANPSQMAAVSPDLLYALALARYRSGAPAGAIEPLKRALGRDPNRAEAYYLLGLASRDAGLSLEAIDALLNAIRLEPTFVPARVELADLYRDEKQLADEIVVRRAIAAVEPTVDRHVELALVNLRAARIDDALAILAQASALDPGSSRVTLALARVHLAEAERLNRPEPAAQALTLLEKALGGTARRSEGLALYGRALYLTGDAAQAERLLKEAVLTSPVDPQAFRYLADAAERQGHPATARHALLRLAALEGDQVSEAERAARLQRIGRLALAAGDVDAAVTHLEAALKTGRQDDGLYAVLAQALLRTGDREGARTAVARGLALAPNSPDLRRLSRQLGN